MRQQTLRDVEVILIDNASTDGSREYVRSEYPEVEVIPLTSNQGFAAAVNCGIGASKAPLIALLNNDTVVYPGWAKALVDAATAHPETALFASKMVTLADRTVIDSCGVGMTWSGRSYNIREGEQDTGQFNQEKEVFGACAGAALYRASLFAAIGLFDETFFAYLEDVDIDFRARLAGFQCLYVPKAVVAHIGSATSGKGSAFAFRLMVKNHFHLIHKNYPTALLWKHSAKLLYAEARLIAAAVRDGHTTAYLSGLGQAVRESPQMYRRRKDVQGMKAVSAEQLNQVIFQNFQYGKHR